MLVAGSRAAFERVNGALAPMVATLTYVEAEPPDATPSVELRSAEGRATDARDRVA